MFASLPCSWAIAPTTTIPTTLSSSSSSKASSRRHLQASCNAPNGDPNQHDGLNMGKFDRRNLLVGLGGLYGAANLGSDKLASAAPVPLPDFHKCEPPRDQSSGEILQDTNCCLPISDNIIDYKLPRASIKRFRPAAHQVTDDYIFKYNTAVDRMKRLPKDDPRNFMQQANVHCAYCNEVYEYQYKDEGLHIQVHACWLFFPFHRWYLYFHERILGSLIDDPTFGLPFWHWDSPRGMTVPPMYLHDHKSALFDENRNQENMKSMVRLNLNFKDQPEKKIIANNLRIMYDEMIKDAKTLECFMGKRYVRGTDENPGQGTIERGCHTAVHAFVGDPRQPHSEDMGNFYSTGRDPMFYAHHANLDRLWSVWRDLRGPNQDKDFRDLDHLNTEFLFYDENKQLVRVKVADCLDQERMGYTYQRVDNPWIHYRPLPRLHKSNAVAISNAPKLDQVVFPVKLEKDTVKVVVPRLKRSVHQEEDEEVLQIEIIEVDKTKLSKFDVFVNDDDGDVDDLDRGEYAGTFSQLPHRSGEMKMMKTSITLNLTELFQDLGIEDDDDEILVSLVPRMGVVTIGGVKIVYGCA